ncbi:MAG TPA: tRNA methyl transferase PRC-barrel domain-containing protein, partial [Pseudonocardiaceae bacterium]|nr:tRNA methyl transferase PRC-barrel domain-containing protein [Pseudonocardiaceae bacterium]
SVVDGAPSLRRSADAAKDQSYVLASLRADQLRHAMFPLGDSTKPVVRAEAAARGLTVVAEKPDSHDICFIPDGDTRSFLNKRLGTRTGALIDDETGAVLGEHDGVHGFTVGQRKGLGIEAPAATGRPRYVLALEPVSGNVRVGAAERLAVTEITGIRPVWPGGTPLTDDMTCTVQVRAHGGLASATASLAGDELVIRLTEPLSGVAPGQAAVLYRSDPVAGDLVLASTTISATR